MEKRVDSAFIYKNPIHIYYLLYAEFHDRFSFTNTPNKMITCKSTHPVEPSVLVIIPDQPEIVTRALELLTQNGYPPERLSTEFFFPINDRFSQKLDKMETEE